MTRRLNIKNFKVTDVITGAIAQSGRESTMFLSQSTLLNDLSNATPVVNKLLTEITDASLNSHAHLSRSYIKIVREYTQDISSIDAVFIPDGIMRITFLRENAQYNSSLLYAFSPYSTTPINSLQWNVAIANTQSQTTGDYFDIQLPDQTYYPSLYISFLIIKDAWILKRVIDPDQKICSITNITRFYYSINPQTCIYNRNRKHFVVCNGLDTTTGIQTRITFAVEADRHGFYCNCDFNDIVFSLSSRTYLNEDQIK